MKSKNLASLAGVVIVAVLLSGCGAATQPSAVPDLAVANPVSPAGVAHSAAQSRIFVGLVSAISTDQWTIGGLPFNANGATELKDQLAPGDRVAAHVTANSDGSFTLNSIETAPAGAAAGWSDDSGAASSAEDSSGSESSLVDFSSSSSGSLDSSSGSSSSSGSAISSSGSSSSSGSFSSADSSSGSSSSSGSTSSSSGSPHPRSGGSSGGADKGGDSGKGRHGGGSGGQGGGGGNSSSGH